MAKKSEFIPVCEPFLTGNEMRYVRESIKTGWISSGGRFVGEFENNFAKFSGNKYGVSVTNGTTALHTALLALGIGSGDEVIIPDFTMVACLFAVLYVGATPVFVDADADTWNMDVSQIEEKITKKTKAVMVVHIYGHPVDMTPVKKLAKKHGLKIIEDAAEAHGATYKGKSVGCLGDVGCFSFYGNKILTTGEGGMVVTNNKKIYDQSRYYKNLCFSLDGPRDYLHHELGFNYRMTNVAAAIGLAQLEKANELVERRRKNADRYIKRLKDVPGLSLPVERGYAKNVYWMFGVVVEKKMFGVSRDELAERLKEGGIDTRVFFQPMHKQPVLKKYRVKSKGSFPVSEYLAKNGLYLPSGSGLKLRQINRVCQEIKKIHEEG